MPCVSHPFDPSIGPIVDVGIAEAGAFRSVGGSNGQLPFRGYRALVDTGADRTCISRQIADEIGLRPTGKLQMASASEVSETNTYLVDLALAFGDPSAGAMSVVRDNVMVMEFESNNKNYQVLLGRDFISNGLFSMTGYDKRFTICL